jgi:multiple sugar transport system substrate-binding protein
MSRPRRELPRRTWASWATWATSAALAALAALAGGCGNGGRQAGTTIRFWAMGREGEVVQELVADFEREHPDVHVIVQQIPWGAAHEKLLTAHVGRSTPDAAQLGNTWIAEFAALRAIAPLGARLATSASVRPDAYFPGIWDTNVLDGVVYGVPWYVDTRVLFYRRDLLAQAGYDSIPATWDGWRRAMEAMKRVGGPQRFAIFLPTNEYTPWIVFGLQAGSTLLKDDDTRGDFSGPAYRRAAAFYLDLFRRGLAPAVPGASIANRYQEFERGTFGMYVSGPWDLGEFGRRLAPQMQSAWTTAPLPGPSGRASGVSTAGGSSLVLFRTSRHPDAAWQLIEFLSRPEQQVRFSHLTGDLPARRESWKDTTLSRDPKVLAFADQLERVVSTPKIPEWENISMKLEFAVEAMVLGHAPADSTLAALDRDVDRILEKRRWLVERERAAGRRASAAR